MALFCSAIRSCLPYFIVAESLGYTPSAGDIQLETRLYHTGYK